MVEKFDGAHIAVPLPDKMSFSWAINVMKIIERGRFPEMRDSDSPPHMTLYHLGSVNNEQLNQTKEVLEKYSDEILGSKLRAIGLMIIGSQLNQALVIDVENTPQLTEFRRMVEHELPEFADHNYPLRPHFTITELRIRKSIKIARNIVQEGLPNRNKSESTTIKHIQVFYK